MSESEHDLGPLGLFCAEVPNRPLPLLSGPESEGRADEKTFRKAGEDSPKFGTIFEFQDFHPCSLHGTIYLVCGFVSL